MSPSERVVRAVAIWNARQPPSLPRYCEIVVTAREVQRLRERSRGGTALVMSRGHWCRIDHVRRSRAINNLTGQRLMVVRLRMMERVT